MSQNRSQGLPILLIQVRNPRDPMNQHEEECITEHLGAGFVVTAHNAVNTPLSEEVLHHYAGIVIGGSGDYSVHHPKSRPWTLPLQRFIERALTLNVPGFGLCFGHQLLGTVLGATVKTEPAKSEVGTIHLDLTEKGRQDPVFGGLSPTFPVHTGHSDYVIEVPTGVTLLATSPRVKTQAFQVSGSSFYSTQFHPDLTGAQARERYLASKAHIRSPSPQGELLFEPGKDEATSLLRRFAQQLPQRP
ncbi:MAG: type 1 glutamine amidotransferase [Myxococcota bacterium]|nr:type 1 glutamine amidotransferase [Myxococcota bacterium]